MKLYAISLHIYIYEEWETDCTWLLVTWH